MRTFKQYVNLNENYKSASDYAFIQRWAIEIWGKTMYLEYDNLPEGLAYLHEFERELKLAIREDPDEAEEWAVEGARVNGRPLLTRNLYDMILSTCQTKLSEPLVVYKTGPEILETKRYGWVSCSTTSGGYEHLGPKISEFRLSEGDKVIWAFDLADRNEVIVHSRYLK